MTATIVAVPGGRLNVVDEGRAGDPPILLVHAAVSDLRSWDEVAAPLVAAGHRVIRYDLRGFGGSTTEDVDYSSRADAVAVLDALGMGRAALVGNSAGGQIMLDTAIEYPDRAVAVVGVGSGLGGFEGESTEEELALFAKSEALESAETPDVEAIVDLDVRAWLDGIGQPDTRVPAAMRERFRELDAPQYEPGRVHGRPIALEPPAAERLAELRCPVLALAGGLDVSDVAQAARFLEANAPVARALILPDVAHMIGMEIPDKLAALIVEFLAPLPRWS